MAPLQSKVSQSSVKGGVGIVPGMSLHPVIRWYFVHDVPARGAAVNRATNLGVPAWGVRKAACIPCSDVARNLHGHCNATAQILGHDKALQHKAARKVVQVVYSDRTD
jgi:hypothetical protein